MQALSHLLRRKRKRVVDMTNEEAAEYYLRRARSAQAAGEMAHANRLYHSAMLHDPKNLDAAQGFKETDAPAHSS